MATTSIGASGVTFPDGGVQSGATNGIPALNVYTSSGTWTKPATVKAIKVTVVGGGGNGGTASKPTASPGSPTNASAGGGGGGGSAIRVYPASSLPGPQPYTVGGAGATSSFGAAPATVITATGGTSTPITNGIANEGGTAGVGSGGQLNMRGDAGNASGPYMGGNGGSSILGGGAKAVKAVSSPQVGANGSVYGGGGAGGVVEGTTIQTIPGGAGAAGAVIIEEFY